MFELKDKNVLVTGATGFIGQRLMTYLSVIEKAAKVVGPDSFADFVNNASTDSYFERKKRHFKDNSNYDVVFNLAGVTGNVKSHGLRPVDAFIDNTLIGLNILRACHKYDVKKVVSVVASCAYPHKELVTYECGSQIEEKEVMNEWDFFEGPPHESIEAHAYAKRNLQLASKYYNEQYGCDFVCVCPPTVYGPGDSFDPSKTKVMGSLIKKICDAKKENKQEIVCWGSGWPLREFLYIDDCVRLLAQSILYMNSEVPLNIGSGQEISIKKLAELIAKTVGYTGKIVWDLKEPDGQHRKLLDSERMECILGVQPFTTLEVGIKNTVSWYMENS